MSWAQGPCVAVVINTATSMSKGEKMRSAFEGKFSGPIKVVFLKLIPPQGKWLIQGPVLKLSINQYVYGYVSKRGALLAPKYEKEGTSILRHPHYITSNHCGHYSKWMGTMPNRICLGQNWQPPKMDTVWKNPIGPWYFILVVPFEKMHTAHAGELGGTSAFADHLVGSLGRGVTWFDTSVGGFADLIINLP